MGLNKTKGENEMSENGKKDNVEINYFAPVREFDNKTTIIYNTGFEMGSTDKYQIVWPVPQNDNEAQERYGCSIMDIVAFGVRNLATKPNYKLVGFDKNGNLKPDGHEEMQKLADGYQPGRRIAMGTSQKAIVQNVKKAEKELDMTHDQMIAKLKELKEQGLL